MRERIENFVEGMVSLVYPNTCPVCDGIRPRMQVCPQCEGKLKYIREPRCKKCSKHIVMEEMEYCMDCSRQQHDYDTGISLFAYENCVKKMIMDYKYHNRREYGKWMAEQMVRYLGEKWQEWECDVVVPVPIHKKKRIKRYGHRSKIQKHEKV